MRYTLLLVDPNPGSVGSTFFCPVRDLPGFRLETASRCYGNDRAEAELQNNNNSTNPVLCTFLKKGNFNLDIFIVQFGETHRGRNKVDSFRTGKGTEATGTGSPGHMLNTVCYAHSEGEQTTCGGL